ncbi:hypothetical protein Tco_1299604 [Tanacetum coccineum]
MAIIQKGKQRGHLPSVGRVLPGQGTYVLSQPPPRCTHLTDVEKLKKSNKRLTKQVSMIMKLFRSDDKMSQMLTQLESSHEFVSASGSGRCGDDESVMMRTAVRMRRMRRMPIVRRCYIWVNIDLYLEDNACFMTSSLVL